MIYLYLGKINDKTEKKIEGFVQILNNIFYLSHILNDFSAIFKVCVNNCVVNDIILNDIQLYTLGCKCTAFCPFFHFFQAQNYNNSHESKKMKNTQQIFQPDSIHIG